MWGVKEKRYGLCFALFLAQEKWGNLFQNANALLAGKSCTVGAGADDRFTVLGIRTTYSIYSSVSLREESAEIPARFIVSTAWFKVFIKSRTSLKSLMGAFFCFFANQGYLCFQKLLNELSLCETLSFPMRCDRVLPSFD